MPPKRQQNDKRKVFPEPPPTSQRSSRVQQPNPPPEIPRDGQKQKPAYTAEDLLNQFKKKKPEKKDKIERRASINLMEEQQEMDEGQNEEIQKKIFKKFRMENREESVEEIKQNEKIFVEEEKSINIERQELQDYPAENIDPNNIFENFSSEITPIQQLTIEQQQQQFDEKYRLGKQKLIEEKKRRQLRRRKEHDYVAEKRQKRQSNWDGQIISLKKNIRKDNKNIEKVVQTRTRIPRMAQKEGKPALIVYGKQDYTQEIFKGRKIIKMLDNIDQVQHARNNKIYSTDEFNIILRPTELQMTSGLVRVMLLAMGLDQIDIDYMVIAFRELGIQYNQFKQSVESINNPLETSSLIVQNLVIKGMGVITKIISKILTNTTLNVDVMDELGDMRIENLKGNFVEMLMNASYLRQMQQEIYEDYSEFDDLFRYLFQYDQVYELDYRAVRSQILEPMSRLFVYAGDEDVLVGLHHTKQLRNYVDFILQFELKRNDFQEEGFSILPEQNMERGEYNYKLQKQRGNMFQFNQIFVLNSMILNYLFQNSTETTKIFLNIYFCGNIGAATNYDMKYGQEEVIKINRIPLRWSNIGYMDKLQEMIGALNVERVQEWRYFKNQSQGFMCSHINTLAFTSGTITVDASNNIIPSNAFNFLDSEFDGIDTTFDQNVDMRDPIAVNAQVQQLEAIINERFRDLAEILAKELYFDDQFINYFDKGFIRKQLCIQFMFKLLSRDIQQFKQNKDKSFKRDKHGNKIPRVITDVNGKEHFVWDKQLKNKFVRIKGFERVYKRVNPAQWLSWFKAIEKMKYRSKQMTNDVNTIADVTKDEVFQQYKKQLIDLLLVLVRSAYEDYERRKDSIILEDDDGEQMLDSNSLVDIEQRDVVLQLDRIYFNFYDNDLLSERSARDLRYQNILNYKDPRTNTNKPSLNNKIYINNVFAGIYYFSQYYSKGYLEFVKKVDFNLDNCLYSLAYYLNEKFGVQFEDQQELKNGNMRYFLQALIDAQLFNIAYLDFQHKEFRNFDFNEDFHTVGIAVFNNHVFETDCNFEQIRKHLEKVEKDSLGIQIRQHFTEEINKMTENQSKSIFFTTQAKILLKTNKTLQLCGRNLCVSKQQLFIFYDLETTCNEDNIEIIILSYCLVIQIEGEVDVKQFENIQTLVVLEAGENIVAPFVRMLRRQYELSLYEKILIGGWNSNKFDNILILKELFKVFKRDQICLKGSTNNIKFMCIANTIYFTDFMKATCVQMSLEKFTQQFGKGIQKHGNEEDKIKIQKIMKSNTDLKAWIDQTEEDKKLYIQYCENDVFSMCMSIFNFNGIFVQSVRSIKPECLPKKCPSIFTINSLPQTAFKLMKAVVIKGEIQVLYKEQQYNAARQSYRGGITQLFQMKKYEIGVNSAELQYIDVNSLYPSVMAKCPFFNIGIVCKDVSEDHIQPHQIKERHLYGLRKFLLPAVPFAKHGYIPISDIKTGQLTYPTVYEGPQIQYVWGFQLQQIYQICQEYGVAEQLVFKFEYLFLGTLSETKQFEDIQVLYNARKKFEKEGNKTQAQIYKLIMNSAYGQFGMKEFDASIYVQSEYYDELNRNKGSMSSYIKNTLLEQLEDPKNLTITKVNRSEEVGLIRLDFKKNVKTIPVGQKQRLVHIASQITARSRDVLLKKVYALNLKGIEVLYCDTDSIIYSRPPHVLHNIKEDTDIDGEILGKWKQEVEKILSVRCYAPKLYQIQYEDTDKDGNITIKDILRSKGVSFKDMKKEQIQQMYLDLDQCSDDYLNNKINQGVVVKNQIAFYRKQGAIAINEIQKTLKIKNWRGRDYFI